MSVISRVDSGCPTLDEPITDHAIAGSVGVGGANRRADVKTVQQLLNALSPLEGGPNFLLAEDGLVGPKTRDAISKYQSQVLRFSDGRVDVDGPTIKRLTKTIVDSPTVPFGKLGAPQSGTPGPGAPNTGPVPSTLGADSVAVAHLILRVLEPRLNLLRFKLTRTTPPMLALLNKHFAHKSQTVTNADIGHVQTILAGIHRFIARFNAFGKLPAENVILFDPAPNPSVIGRTVRGGDKLSTQQVQIYVDKNGVASKDPGQSIWLTSLFATQPSHEKHWVILHEFAHFVGARDGVFTAINDNAYAFENRFLTLSKFDRLHNAESLSLFFLEVCVGTQAIAVLPRLSSARAHFDAFPKVTPSGDIVTS
jgi:peptidoglycan hydrolase-like protein with peptidoglycan-binding domain